MPKGSKKQNMKPRNENNFQNYYKNRPMNKDKKYNAQNFGNSQSFDYMRPSNTSNFENSQSFNYMRPPNASNFENSQSFNYNMRPSNASNFENSQSFSYMRPPNASNFKNSQSFNYMRPPHASNFENSQSFNYMRPPNAADSGNSAHYNYIPPANAINFRNTNVRHPNGPNFRNSNNSNYTRPSNSLNVGKSEYFNYDRPSNQPYVPNQQNKSDEPQSIKDNISPGSSKEPRVVEKRNLYISSVPEPIQPKTYTLSYSGENVTNWQRASDPNTEAYSPQSHIPPSKNARRKQPQVQKNKVEKTLNTMLSKPVEISKGKSLLEKMGWTGGGLGKEGTGILDPIVPKATYAVNTIGLGHNSEIQGKQKQNPKQKQKKPQRLTEKFVHKFKHNFQTNVLMEILEFVKNDSEEELLFDKSLYNSERKKIHALVQDLRDCVDVSVKYTKPQDIEVASEILKHNVYLLQTVSYGVAPNRSLRVYKEAPSYVYLITPADLRDDGDEEFDDFCEPLDIDNEDKDETEIDTFTEKVKHSEVEKDGTVNINKDPENVNINFGTQETTALIKDLDTKNDEVSNKLNKEKVSDSEKLTEVENSTSDVNCQLDSKICLNNHDTDVNESNEKSVPDTKKLIQVDSSTSDVNCQLDSKIHSKNDDSYINHELNVEKVADNKEITESDDNTSNVNCQLVSKQNSETENLECSSANGKKSEEVSETNNLNDENPVNEPNENSEEIGEKSVLSVIVDYFKEFIIDTNFLEFRFLGPFNSDESDAINKFFDICLKRETEDCDEKNEILKTLDNDVYYIGIQKDLNGSYMVSKSEKCLQNVSEQ